MFQCPHGQLLTCLFKRYLSQLTALNLDYNHLTTLKPLLQPDVALALQHLTRLSLRDNALGTLLGLEALAALTELDVARNALASLDELRRFALFLSKN